jgi:MoaA/NifB/PqqE/SkfB family radical SAM enzyme
LREITRIEIELNNICNLQCPLCIRQTHPELTDNKTLDYNVLIERLENLKDLKYVTLAGPTSEPTLYKKLVPLLRYLKMRDIEVSLFINGDTHDDMYYRKLGMLFKGINGHIYLTVCGSTQELHEKYRVGSNLNTVLRRLDIINLYSKKGILNYIVFNYNKDDDRSRFNKYKAEYFHTLPVSEHFELDSEIHLPKLVSEAYSTLNREDITKECPAEEYNFALLSSDNKLNPCSLFKNFGDKHCWECSKNNSKILSDNKIYRLAEAESDTSELALHLKGR